MNRKNSSFHYFNAILRCVRQLSFCWIRKAFHSVSAVHQTIIERPYRAGKVTIIGLNSVRSLTMSLMKPDAAKTAVNKLIDTILNQMEMDGLIMDTATGAPPTRHQERRRPSHHVTRLVPSMDTSDCTTDSDHSLRRPWARQSTSSTYQTAQRSHSLGGQYCHSPFMQQTTHRAQSVPCKGFV